MDSVLWGQDLMGHLVEMCQALKPGSRVLTWQDLPREGFAKNGTVSVPVSWFNIKADYQLYTKISASNKTGSLGKTQLLTLGDVISDGSETRCVY